MKPGPELDALVAKGVMGWNWQIDSPTAHLRYCTVPTKKMPDTRRLFSPSTDIAAAWEVVEHWTNDGGWFVMTFRHFDNDWYCSLGKHDNDVIADTMPLAVCLSALKAAGEDI